MKGLLLVFRGDFAGGVEIVMDGLHDVHDFPALFGIMLLSLALTEIVRVGILGIEELIV